MPGPLLIPLRAHRSIRLWYQKLIRAKEHHSLPAFLPPELWECIIAHLDSEDLFRIYLLNRTFYNAFLSRKYRYISLDLPSPTASLARKQIALLRVIRNPIINNKCQSLYFNCTWEHDLTKCLEREGWEHLIPVELEDWKSYYLRARSGVILSVHGRLEEAKSEAARQMIYESVGMLNSIHSLTVTLHPAYTRKSLDILWTACSQNLVSLSLLLIGHLRTRNYKFGLDVTCPRLRSLYVTAFPESSPYPELLTDLRGLIPEDGGSLEELFLCLYGVQVLFTHIHFGSLRKLHLYFDPIKMPLILPFVAHHRDQIQEVTLDQRLSKDWRILTHFNIYILTSLSIHAETLLEQRDHFFPILSRCTCLRTLHLLDYRHLRKQSSAERTPHFIILLDFLPPAVANITLPGLVIDFKFFLAISRNVPAISSLMLSNSYLYNQELEQRILPLFSSLKAVPGSFKATFEYIGERLVKYKQKNGRGELCHDDEEPIGQLFLQSMVSLSCYPSS